MPELNDIAALMVRKQGYPATNENLQRATQILAENPYLQHNVLASMDVPQKMYLGDDFGAPSTMSADVQPSAPTGKDETNATQAIPPPASSTGSQSIQQQTGESGKGSMPDAAPLVPLVAPAAVAGSQAMRNAAQGSVDEGIMNEMLSPPNATEQGILQQIDAADQATKPNAGRQIGDTRYRPHSSRKDVVIDNTTGQIYRVLKNGTVLDGANNVIDPQIARRIMRVLKGIF